MKNTVIRFGIFSSLIMAAGMLTAMHFSNEIGLDKGELLGYTTMAISFLMVFFGIRSYRDKMNGGFITFGKAFKIGSLIALMSCIVYVVTWLVLYYNFMPDFADKYAAHIIDGLKASHASQQEIDSKMKEMASFREMYKNPLYNSAITFTEVAPVAIVMTLISALILKKKKKQDTALAA
jgi:ethanolamine transporter EutH